MSKILVSGLCNVETTLKVHKFPIDYYPIDYPFFGIKSNVSGVAYNIVKALKTLGDDVTLTSFIGNDFEGEYVLNELKNSNIDVNFVKKDLKETPTSIVLYDNDGKRQIYCDLKDIQEKSYNLDNSLVSDKDILVLCNINFNRESIKTIKNKVIATDVHVFNNIHDEYNKDFLENSNILFLSDEAININYEEFIMNIENTYHNDIIVLGMGKNGSLMYVKNENRFYHVPAVDTGVIVNTVGAGDALFSGFIHYYAKGYTPYESLKRATLVASHKICFNGGSLGHPTEEKVEELYKKHM